MNLKSLITLVLAITLSSTTAQVLPPCAASVLQDILSPANTEKALQLIKIAASRSNKNYAIPDRARAVAYDERFARNDYLPRAVVASDYLPRSVVASDYLPRSVVASDYLPARSEPVRVIVNDYGRLGPQVVRQAPGRDFNVQGSLVDSLVFPKEIYQSFPVALPEAVVRPEVRPCQAVPSNPYLPNPYLPVASPVSAMSPSCMPPPTQSRGQFLRKIPIPPPTL